MVITLLSVYIDELYFTLNFISFYGFQYCNVVDSFLNFKGCLVVSQNRQFGLTLPFQYSDYR